MGYRILLAAPQGICSRQILSVILFPFNLQGLSSFRSSRISIQALRPSRLSPGLTEPEVSTGISRVSSPRSHIDYRGLLSRPAPHRLPAPARFLNPWLMQEAPNGTYTFPSLDGHAEPASSPDTDADAGILHGTADAHAGGCHRPPSPLPASLQAPFLRRGDLTVRQLLPRPDGVAVADFPQE